jgi:SpoVK/Ycf46/Vps4 family AAA+-type ATPase
MFNEAEAGTSTGSIDDLLSGLKWLDRLLERAVATAQVVYGPKAAADPYRGLYINPAETERLLAREPGAPLLGADRDGADEPWPELPESSRLVWLQRAFALSRFDLALVLVALAPELDLRYERLYAYLQDDVTRRRPTVDLALNLLCPTTEAKLARRGHVAPDAPLVRQALLHLIPDPHQVHPPLLSHYLKLDEQITRFLLGQEGLDARLGRCCQMIVPVTSLDETPLNAEARRALPILISPALDAHQPLRLYFHGPRGVGKRQAAEAVAREAGVSLLVVDLSIALADQIEWRQILTLLLREAWFQNAILYLDGLDALRSDDRAIQLQQLLDALAADDGFTILAGTKPWTPSGRNSIGVLPLAFPIPDAAQRQGCWQAQLALAGIAHDTTDPAVLADRFRLTPSQIAQAVTLARQQAGWQASAVSSAPASSERDGQPGLRELCAAARAQSGHDLATLAHKIEPVYTWDDIVLPDDAMIQLRELCQRVAHRRRVLGQWGFDRKLSLGKGVNALFAGPSGTGKTMAAEIIARALGLDLYKIDLAGIVSKYIGETEKNLDRIFTAAENSNAILFFDEADALFGKRSEVRDSHDRYANIEISYLLQKMEQFDGIAILATNLRSNLDEAFTRRLTFTVNFPFPDESSRLRIWTGIWPAEVPLADDVDLDFLARQFKLSGGNIKNIALAAAFLAAEDGGPVTMAHLLHAVRREFQKMGKIVSEAEFTVTRSP